MRVLRRAVAGHRKRSSSMDWTGHVRMEVTVAGLMALKCWHVTDFTDIDGQQARNDASYRLEAASRADNECARGSTRALT